MKYMIVHIPTGAVSVVSFKDPSSLITPLIEDAMKQACHDDESVCNDYPDCFNCPWYRGTPHVEYDLSEWKD